MLAALLACSDYNIDNTPEKSGEPEDTERHRPDTESGEDSARPETGEATVPGDSDAPDGKLDVVLIVDVAYGYSCYHADLGVRGQELIDALFDSGANVAVAVAHYDDYQVNGEWYANTGGKPYVLDQQLTDDRGAAKSAIAGLSAHFGGDWEGSGFEALAQAAKGGGYDQDCDAGYDSATDVKPFQKSSTDAFGGAVGGAYDSSVSGTGDKGGVGFRDGSKRVIVLAADDRFRDRDEGHEVPSGTCPDAASRSTAEAALKSNDVYFLGINAYEFQDIDNTLQEQLEDMAYRSESWIDADHDGVQDDKAVLNGGWDWPPVGQITDAIWDLTD